MKLNFSLNDEEEEDRFRQDEGDEKNMESMLAAQASYQHDEEALLDEDSIMKDTKTDDVTKRRLLQKALHMAASNGEEERVDKLLKDPFKQYIDINIPDEEGSSPLIYASCFVSNLFISKLSWFRSFLNYYY